MRTDLMTSQEFNCLLSRDSLSNEARNYELKVTIFATSVQFLSLGVVAPYLSHPSGSYFRSLL